MVKGRNKSGQIKAIKSKTKRVPFTTSGISKLPKRPGMYTINQNGEKYIGSTNNIQRRAQEHKRSGKDGSSISYKQAVTRHQAYNMERNSIRKTCPRHNKTKPDSCKGFWEKNFGFSL